MEGFTPKQERAIVLFAQGRRIAEVAQDLDVSHRTVEKWRTDKNFKNAIRLTVRETSIQVLDEIVEAGRAAIGYLRTVVGDTKATEQGRIRAAIAILDNLRSWREIDIEERLEAIEEKFNGNPAQGSYSVAQKN
ncbi:MAG: helix-turn-helix domain-containing protein [Brasilonema sp.]